MRGDKLVLRARDLWGELRERIRRLEVNLDEAERELDDAEKRWIERLKERL